MATSIALLPDRTRAVGFVTALRQQLVLLGASRRWAYLSFGMLAGLLMARLIGGATDVPLHLAVALLGMPIALFWALAVWHGEGTDRRLYHWSLPVARPLHDLARVAAGVPYLLGAYAVLAAGGAAVAALDGTFARFMAIAPGTWANYFVGPIIVYLIVMPLALWRDYAITRRILVGWLAVGWIGLALSLVFDLSWLGALFDPWFYDSTRALANALFDGLLREVTGGVGTDAIGWAKPALVWLGIGAAATMLTTAFRPDDVRRMLRRF